MNVKLVKSFLILYYEKIICTSTLFPVSYTHLDVYKRQLLPRASEAWHCAQLFMNKRSPMAMACASLDTSSGGIAANLAYKGAVSALPLSTSDLCCPADVQPKLPL